MNRIARSFIGAACLALVTDTFAAGALSVSREVVVDRSPDTVWKLIGDFNALDVWLPPVLASKVEGQGSKPGAIRVLDLGNNASVTEKLVTYNKVTHSYTYAFIKSPLPVKNYVATIQLESAPDGKTLLKWSSTFDAAGAPDDKAKEAILGIYDAGLAKAAAIFKK